VPAQVAAAAPAAVASAAAGRNAPAAPAPKLAQNAAAPPAQSFEPSLDARHSEIFYEFKTSIFTALIEAIDLSQLAKLDADSSREEIRDIVNEIISIKNIVMSISEQEGLLDDICNDVLGYGPLEPVLARDDVSDVMVNGATTVYVEIAGKIQRTGIRFRDNQQLLNICQRIVSQVGRRVDESSPICDARLPDGSRVNVIAPPLSIDGPTLTIRKFKKDKNSNCPTGSDRRRCGPNSSKPDTADRAPTSSSCSFAWSRRWRCCARRSPTCSSSSSSTSPGP
jgi:pilus assembly protein CpaF